MEKFYFAGADYKSPLTKLQLTLSAMNQTVDEDGKQPSDAAPTTMRRVSVIKRRPSSANSSLQLRRQSMTSSPSHHAASDTSVIDSEMEDELRRGILQPKMSLPL